MRLGNKRFPALSASGVYFLRLVIGSFDCQRVLWLPRVITFVHLKTFHHWPVTRVSRRDPITVPLRASLALFCDRSFSLFLVALVSVVCTVIVARISASASVILSKIYRKNSSHLPLPNRWRKDFCNNNQKNKNQTGFFFKCKVWLQLCALYSRGQWMGKKTQE